MYTGPVDPTFKTQIHDYDPGITSSGLFWTIAIPELSAAGDPDDAEAFLRLSDLAISDYGSIPNGLFHMTPPLPGKVSLDLRWSGAKKRGTFSDSTKRFQMEFVQTGARISWQGQTGSDTFHTTGGTQRVNFAQIAEQRSGFFFDADDD